ncbi:MAG: hypothetical protein PF517_12225, partial [Salinivirgaceae bacterium]|nr:hypothetical protein [Salinivirgaceae bacterium]
LSIALLRYNPDAGNVVFHRIGEVKSLHFLHRLSVIAQFGFYSIFDIYIIIKFNYRYKIIAQTN